MATKTKTTAERAKDAMWCVCEVLYYCDMVLKSEKATLAQKKKAEEDEKNFHQRYLVLDEILSRRQSGDIGTQAWRHAIKRFRLDIDPDYIPYEGYVE